MLRKFGEFMIFLLFLACFFLSIWLAILAVSLGDGHSYNPPQWSAALGALSVGGIAIYIFVVFILMDGEDSNG